MAFQPGDRVRWDTTGDDGLPLIRYGFVGAGSTTAQQVVVMFDGEFKGDTLVAIDELQPVTITNVELRLRGADLLADPSLRQGLVNLWSAEADQAGLEIRHIEYLENCRAEANASGMTLAELRSGGKQYVLRALYDIDHNESVCVRADLP